MRLELMILPDAVHRVFADALGLGQRTGAPVGCPGRLGLQSGFHHPSHPLGRKRRLAASSWGNLPDAANTQLATTPSPEGHRPAMNLKLRRDLLILFVESARQKNLRPKRDLLRRRSCSNPLFESGDFSLGEIEGRTFA